MVQLKDEEYWGLADIVYLNSSLKIEKIKNLSLQQLEAIKPMRLADNTEWVTLNSINDKSGLQAIAVVSFDEYKALCAGEIQAPQNLVFVTRGSEMGEDVFNDWVKTNMGNLGTGGKPEELKQFDPTIIEGYDFDDPNEQNQFIQYDLFVRQTLKQFTPKEHSFTGHSLGGALAQYMAVLTDASATTFAAAKAYRLLPKELQKRVQNGEYDDLIKDYRHKNDPVGYLPNGEIIGSRIMAKSAKSDLWIVGHTRPSFSNMFAGDGSIRLRVSPDEIRDQLSLFDSAIQNLHFTHEMLETVTDELDQEVRSVHQNYIDETGRGGFSHLTVTDVDDIFDEFAQSSSGNTYYFCDRQKKEELLDDLQRIKLDLLQKQEFIGQAATEFERMDADWSKNIAGLLGE